MRFTRSWTPRMWRRVRRLLVALALAGLVLGVIASIELGLVLLGSALMGLVLLESTLMRSIIVEGQRQQHALTQIRPLMGELPLNISGWAADAILIHNTVRLIVEVRPKLVVECGSGTSTIVIGRCLRALGHGQIISLEHEAEHARSTSDLVRLHALDGVVTVVTTPLIPVNTGTESGLWYGTEYERLITDPIDVVLVDGPPGSVGPRARYPAIPVLKSRLAPECWVLLDDGDRPDERAIAHAWRSELNGKLLYLEGGRGGWLLHRAPKPPVTPGLTSR
jgi:predicted O-methyltransferase YrrM